MAIGGNNTVFFLASLATFATVVFATGTTTTTPAPSTDEVCSYTFNVPSPGGEPCLPGANSGASIESLRLFLSGQHTALNQKLDAITVRLEAIASGCDEEPPSSQVNGTGVNYVRWGRTTCPDAADTVLIYEGHMGKSLYTQGGGVNYLCLPTDPEFPEGTQFGHQSQSYVYGVEYERHNSPLIDQALHDHDAPCAVCEAQTRNQVLVIPAKLSCPGGWTEEYTGLLMAQHHSQRSSEYVCVSSGMETIDSGSPNDNGGLLYVVEAVCGSLPCPPFTQGYEIGCVVCTK